MIFQQELMLPLGGHGQVELDVMFFGLERRIFKMSFLVGRTVTGRNTMALYFIKIEDGAKKNTVAVTNTIAVACRHGRVLIHTKEQKRNKP